VANGITGVSFSNATADALDMDLNIARGLYTVHLQDLLSSKECYGKLVIR
jgi:hypothetical protein